MARICLAGYRLKCERRGPMLPSSTSHWPGIPQIRFSASAPKSANFRFSSSYLPLQRPGLCKLPRACHWLKTHMFTLVLEQSNPPNACSPSASLLETLPLLVTRRPPDSILTVSYLTRPSLSHMIQDLQCSRSQAPPLSLAPILAKQSRSPKRPVPKPECTMPVVHVADNRTRWPRRLVARPCVHCGCGTSVTGSGYSRRMTVWRTICSRAHWQPGADTIYELCGCHLEM